jgi:hypothetical protein
VYPQPQFLTLKLAARQVLKHSKRRRPIQGVDRIHARDCREILRRRCRAKISVKSHEKHGPTDRAPIRATDSVPVIVVRVRSDVREVAMAIVIGVREEIVVTGREETVVRVASAPTTENLLDQWIPQRQSNR